MKVCSVKQIYLFIFLLLIGGHVSAQVIITGISPAKGEVGSTVTISGSSFNTIPSNNVVWFGAAKATVTGGDALKLIVKVPPGATFSPLSVLNTATGLSAYSINSFLPTYSPNTGNISVADFAGKQSHITSSGPKAIVISDLDGDGLPDIAVATTISDVISVLRNTSVPGALTFAARADFLVGRTPGDIKAADIDGDGKPDLIVVNPNSNTISVLRNTSTIGNLSFVRKDFVTTAGPDVLAVGDFDADGKPDVAVSSEDLGSVLRNISTPGNVAFNSKIDFEMGSFPTDIVVGDIDGDTKPEIVTANLDGRMSVVRNLCTPGNISFAVRKDFLTNSSPRSITIGDFDDDGKYDLALPGNGLVSIMRNTSNPGIITFAAATNVTSGSSGFDIASGDVDGDGKPDLASANWLAPLAERVSVIRNTGNIGIPSFAANISLVWGRGPIAIVIGDLNQDGKPELVVANNNDQSITIFRNGAQVPVDATLMNLAIDPGTILPAFDPGVMDYQATVAQDVAEVRIIPTSSSPGSVIKVNGITVISGNPSDYIQLLTGQNIINVTVTASDGVTKKEYTVNIRRAKGDQVLTFDLLPVKTSCDEDFAAGAMSTNQTNPILYSSSNLAVASISPDGVIHLIAPGETIITVSQLGNNDFNAAVPITRTLTVSAPVIPEVRILSDRSTVCHAEQVTLSAEVSNIGSPVSYQWQANGQNIGDDSPTLFINPTDANVIYRCVVATSCHTEGISNELTVNVTAPVQPAIYITSSINHAIKGVPVTFTAAATNGGSMPVYRWQINGIAAGTDHPVFTTTDLSSGDLVNCILISSMDCALAVTSNTIVMVISEIAKIPSAFSPNGDGINDRWVLTGFTEQPVSVSLYGRTGTLVYASKKYLNDWDGSHNGTPLPVGTYYYIIKSYYDQKKFSGAVTIIR